MITVTLDATNAYWTCKGGVMGLWIDQGLMVLHIRPIQVISRRTGDFVVIWKEFTYVFVNSSGSWQQTQSRTAEGTEWWSTFSNTGFPRRFDRWFTYAIHYDPSFGVSLMEFVPQHWYDSDPWWPSAYYLMDRRFPPQSGQPIDFSRGTVTYHYRDGREVTLPLTEYSAPIGGDNRGQFVTFDYRFSTEVRRGPLTSAAWAYDKDLERIYVAACFDPPPYARPPLPADGNYPIYGTRIRDHPAHSVTIYSERPVDVIWRRYDAAHFFAELGTLSISETGLPGVSCCSRYISKGAGQARIIGPVNQASKSTDGKFLIGILELDRINSWCRVKIVSCRFLDGSELEEDFLDHREIDVLPVEGWLDPVTDITGEGNLETILTGPWIEWWPMRLNRQPEEGHGYYYPYEDHISMCLASGIDAKDVQGIISGDAGLVYVRLLGDTLLASINLTALEDQFLDQTIYYDPVRVGIRALGATIGPDGAFYAAWAYIFNAKLISTGDPVSVIKLRCRKTTDSGKTWTNVI